MQVLSFSLSKCHKTEVLRILLGMFSFCPHTLCTRHHTIWVEQLLFLIPPRQLLFITNWNTFCLDKNICDLHCGESIPHTGTEAMAAPGSANVTPGRINRSEKASIRQPWQQKVQGLRRWSWEPSEGTGWWCPQPPRLQLVPVHCHCHQHPAQSSVRWAFQHPLGWTRDGGAF